jgi:hypothetical protein
MRRWYVCPMLKIDILDDNQTPTEKKMWVSKVYNLGYHNHAIIVGNPDIKPWCLTFVRDDNNDWSALDTPDCSFIGELPDNEAPEWFHTQTFNSLGLSNQQKTKFKNFLDSANIVHSQLDDNSPILLWLELVRDYLGGNPIQGMSV